VCHTDRSSQLIQDFIIEQFKQARNLYQEHTYIPALKRGLLRIKMIKTRKPQQAIKLTVAFGSSTKAVLA